jgi:acyl-CoA reductase-like NAD-dependent aldehyde dehydrogenase
MTDDPINLTPLDPTADAARFDALVRGITARAEPILEARRARLTSVGQISAWRRPVLLLAAAIALVAGVTLLQPRQTSTRSETTLADAIGMPSSVASWIRTGTTPSPADLLITSGGTQ